MPTFNNNGRARWFYDFNQFPTSRLPLLHQIEPQPITRSGAENGIPQWQFHYWPNEDRIGSPRMIGAPSSCLEFVVGPRRTVSSSGATGDSLFSRCVWDASFAGTVEWAVYSTNWGTQERNGNSRGRNQVLLWTQKNQQCCVSDGRSDTVTQGIWRFEHLSSNPALHGAEFRLPSSGQL